MKGIPQEGTWKGRKDVCVMNKKLKKGKGIHIARQGDGKWKGKGKGKGVILTGKGEGNSGLRFDIVGKERGAD